ncbi:MAG: hypothetical protein ABIG61_07280 [Planctomycetota bacterium]
MSEEMTKEQLNNEEELELDQADAVDDDYPDGEVGNEADDLGPEQFEDDELDEDGNVIEYEDTPAERNAGDAPAQNADTQRLDNVESRLGQVAQMLQNLTGTMQQQQRQQAPPQQQPQHMGNQMEPDFDSMTPREQANYAVFQAVQRANFMAQNMMAQQRNEFGTYLNRANKAIDLLMADRPDKDIIYKAMEVSKNTGIEFEVALRAERGLAAADKNKQLTNKVDQHQRTNKRRRNKASQSGGRRPVAGPSPRVTSKDNSLTEDIVELAAKQGEQHLRPRRRR